MIQFLISALIFGAVFYLVSFFIAWRERNYLVGDVEPTGQPYPYVPLPYWNVTAQHAMQLGFTRGGEFATRKSTSPVKGLESLWLSPDRRVIASIVSAKFAGIPLKKTTLTSRLADGRVLMSIDNPLQKDPTGVTERAVLMNAGFAELLTFHMRRIAQAGSPAAPFTNPALMSETEQIEVARGSRLVEMGLARWDDPQRHVLRYTFKGAVRHMIDGHVKMPRELRKQSHRAELRRAGSALTT